MNSKCLSLAYSCTTPLTLNLTLSLFLPHVCACFTSYRYNWIPILVNVCRGKVFSRTKFMLVNPEEKKFHHFYVSFIYKVMWVSMCVCCNEGEKEWAPSPHSRITTLVFFGISAFLMAASVRSLLTRYLSKINTISLLLF